MLLATRPSKKFNDQYGGKMCQNLCSAAKDGCITRTIMGMSLFG